jgi:hypothetical protein
MYKGTLPQASTDSDLTITIRWRDSNTGLGFRMTGFGVEVALKDYTGATRLSATETDGNITFYPENNIPDCVMVLIWPAADMNQLCPGTYTLAGRVTSETSTIQAFKYNQPIIEGGI